MISVIAFFQYSIKHLPLNYTIKNKYQTHQWKPRYKKKEKLKSMDTFFSTHNKTIFILSLGCADLEVCIHTCLKKKWLPK